MYRQICTFFKQFFNNLHLYWFDTFSHVPAVQFDFSCIKVCRVKEFQFRPTQYPEEEGPVVEEQMTGEGARPLPEVASSSTLSSNSNSSQKSLKRNVSKNSVWNCDGEVVTHPNLHVQ